MVYDHHDPEYNEEEFADEMAYQSDMAWDSRYDN